MLLSTLPLGVSITGVTIASSGSGADAAFVTSPSALYDGQPGTSTRISWMTGGSPVIGDYVEFTISLSAEIPARCAAFFSARFSTANLVPAGVKMTCSGKLSSSPVVLGGNAATGVRTFLHPNGATRRPFVFPSASIDQLLLRIYNDKNGSTWATGGELVDLGELWVGKGTDWAVALDFGVAGQGGTLQRKSHENLNWAWAIRAFEQNPIKIVPMTRLQAFGGPGAVQDSFYTTMYELMYGTASLTIPVYLNTGAAKIHAPPPVINTSTIDEQMLCCLTQIGNLGDQGINMTGNGDQYFVSPFSFGTSAP